MSTPGQAELRSPSVPWTLESIMQRNAEFAINASWLYTGDLYIDYR